MAEWWGEAEQFLREQLSLRKIAGKLFWSAITAGLLGIREHYLSVPLVQWTATFALVVLAMGILASLLRPTLGEPALAITIEATATPSAQQPGGNAIAIILTVSLRNRGAPSIADGWDFFVRPPGTDTVFRGIPVAIPPGGTEVSYTKGQKMLLKEQDALYKKVETIPLPSGGKQTGYLIFVIENAKPGDIDRPGTIYELTCRDVRGAIISARVTKPPRVSDEVLQYAGISTY